MNTITVHDSDGEVMAQFGDAKHLATVTLADKVKSSSSTNAVTKTQGETKIHPYFQIDVFANLLRLGDGGPFNISLCDKALRLEYETPLAKYSTIMTRSLLTSERREQK